MAIFIFLMTSGNVSTSAACQHSDFVLQCWITDNAHMMLDQ